MDNCPTTPPRAEALHCCHVQQEQGSLCTQVKLGPAFLIPNGQIGTFGGVTPLRSLVRSRRDLFDVAFAGPAAGGATALGLFIAGLYFSSGGDFPKDLLVPVPTQV